MQSILQIIKISEPTERVSKLTGNKFVTQEAECILLDEKGQPDQVGVLRIPRPLQGTVGIGVFMGTFALSANYKTREIESVLTGLTPVPVRTPPAAKSA